MEPDSDFWNIVRASLTELWAASYFIEEEYEEYLTD